MHDPLSGPAHWHPGAVAVLAAATALYAAAAGAPGRRLGWRPPGARVGRLRALAFAVGTAAATLAAAGPLAAAAHRALSAHMVQHLLLTVVAPPLWLLGTPSWLLAPLTRRPRAARAGAVLTHPAAALGLGSAVLVLWHLPVAFEAALRDDGLHALEHASLVATALCLWWPVAGPPLQAWPQPAPPVQLLTLFLATVPMTAVGSPVAMADRLLYPAHAAGGAALEPLLDQQLGGVLMLVGGTLAYLVAGSVVYFRWALREDAEHEAPRPGGDAGRPAGAVQRVAPGPAAGGGPG